MWYFHTQVAGQAEGTIDAKQRDLACFLQFYVPPLFNPEFNVSQELGYAYLSPDGQQIFVMSLKEDAPSFETLTRMP
jgi:hypothetical protein